MVEAGGISNSAGGFSWDPKKKPRKTSKSSRRSKKSEGPKKTSKTKRTKSRTWLEKKSAKDDFLRELHAEEGAESLEETEQRCKQLLRHHAVSADDLVPQPDFSEGYRIRAAQRVVDKDASNPELDQKDLELGDLKENELEAKIQDIEKKVVRKWKNFTSWREWFHKILFGTPINLLYENKRRTKPEEAEEKLDYALDTIRHIKIAQVGMSERVRHLFESQKKSERRIDIDLINDVPQYISQIYKAKIPQLVVGLEMETNSKIKIIEKRKERLEYLIELSANLAGMMTARTILMDDKFLLKLSKDDRYEVHQLLEEMLDSDFEELNFNKSDCSRFDQLVSKLKELWLLNIAELKRADTFLEKSEDHNHEKEFDLADHRDNNIKELCCDIVLGN